MCVCVCIYIYICHVVVVLENYALVVVNKERNSIRFQSQSGVVLLDCVNIFWDD